jgi:hypothetical protein
MVQMGYHDDRRNPTMTHPTQTTNSVIGLIGCMDSYIK